MTQLAKISHIAFSSVTVSGFYFKGLNTHMYEFRDVKTNRPEHQSIRLMIALVTFYFLNSSLIVSVDGILFPVPVNVAHIRSGHVTAARPAFQLGRFGTTEEHVCRAEPSRVSRLRLQHATGETGFLLDMRDDVPLESDGL